MSDKYDDDCVFSMRNGIMTDKLPKRTPNAYHLKSSSVETVYIVQKYMSLYNMTYFSKNKNVESELYSTNGTASTIVTLPGFNIGTVARSVPLRISRLQTHFHINHGALLNTTGFYPRVANTSIAYAPTVKALANSNALSANQSIDPNSRGFYVVVIGGGGGGGGGRYNTRQQVSNGGGGGGSGGLVGYYFNFADKRVSVTGAYYKYIVSHGGAAGGSRSTDRDGAPGRPGTTSVFRLFNSAGTQIFDITCHGGSGGGGGSSRTFFGRAGARTFTGTAANIASETKVNVSHGANGTTLVRGGTGGVPSFLLQNQGGYNVVGPSGRGGSGSIANGFGGSFGKILLFTLY